MDKLIKLLLGLLLGLVSLFAIIFLYAWHQNALKLASYDLKALMDAVTLLGQQILGALGLHGTLNTSIPFVDSLVSRFTGTKGGIATNVQP